MFKGMKEYEGYPFIGTTIVPVNSRFSNAGDEIKEYYISGGKITAYFQAQ